MEPGQHSVQNDLETLMPRENAGEGAANWRLVTFHNLLHVRCLVNGALVQPMALISPVNWSSGLALLDLIQFGNLI